MNKSQRVYQYIKEQIDIGALAPGERIKINEIAQKLNVSRTPVREALKRLEVENVVKFTFNSSAEVRAFDLDEMEELVMIRQELEPLAARLAAERCDATTIQKLKDIIAQLEKYRVAKDAENYSRLNREFHMTLYQASGAKTLYQLIDDLWTRSERSMLVFTLIPNRLEYSNEEHRKILQAVEAHDGELAEKLLRQQKSEGFVNVIRFLKEYEKLRK